MKEWRKIKGWERYEVSNQGEIRNTETNKILKSRPDKDGYKIITFSINKNRTTKKVHRIVAEAFIPNPNNLPQVNHKDGTHDNNAVDNLEWCTSSQNHLHAYRVLGRKAHHSEKCGRPKKRVLCINTGEVFASATEAAKIVGCSQGAMSTVCRGEKKTCKGKRWVYVS